MQYVFRLFLIPPNSVLPFTSVPASLLFLTLTTYRYLMTPLPFLTQATSLLVPCLPDPGSIFAGPSASSNPGYICHDPSALSNSGYISHGHSALSNPGYISHGPLPFLTLATCLLAHMPLLTQATSLLVPMSFLHRLHLSLSLCFA
jgi:hypothetical protein